MGNETLFTPSPLAVATEHRLGSRSAGQETLWSLQGETNRHLAVSKLTTVFCCHFSGSAAIETRVSAT